jgi:hypothetical protein
MSTKTSLGDLLKMTFVLSLFMIAIWSATLWPKSSNNQSNNPVVDGVITFDEYPNFRTLGSLQLYWFNDENDLYIGIVSPGHGWVGIGFSPVVAHKGANFILGTVIDNVTMVSDQYGSEPYLHEPDLGLGGSDDVLGYAGTEKFGTVLEFHIKLDSGDPYDVVLEPGETYNCLIAYNFSNDDFSVMHTGRMRFVLTLD